MNVNEYLSLPQNPNIEDMKSIRKALEVVIEEMKFRGSAEESFAMKIARSAIVKTQTIQGYLEKELANNRPVS